MKGKVNFMVERKFISREAIPQLQSTVVSKNDDKTYEVKHIFVCDGRKILVRYPRVEITIDTIIDAFNLFPRVFPYGSCMALPYGETEELFTLTIEE